MGAFVSMNAYLAPVIPLYSIGFAYQRARELVEPNYGYFAVGVLVMGLLLYSLLSYFVLAIMTLIKLRRGNIELLIPSIWTHARSILKGDPGELFDLVMPDLKASKGLLGWLSPVGKPFVVIQDEKVLEQVLVKNASNLTKHHAFGVLELFRRTDLPSGDAWKVVHRVASRFSVNNGELQQKLEVMLKQYCVACEQLSKGEIKGDFAEFTKTFYWDLVLLMVLGDANDHKLSALYKDAWMACIAALGSPLAHTLSFFTYLPLPGVVRYRVLTHKLRTIIAAKIHQRQAPTWTVLGVIRDRMSESDQLEIAMEFMFTGASSVTSSLIWLIRHMACDEAMCDKIREEVIQVADKHGTSWLDGQQASECKVVDAALRETLRLYSPIHIGRLSMREFDVVNTAGEKVTFPAHCDIMSNLWFMQRDPDNWPEPTRFDHTRFVDKPNNVPNYHPFSMGIRGCPGQRIAYSVIKMVAANVALRYKLRPLPDPPAEPCFERNLMLPVTPKHIYLEFERLRK